MTIMLKLEAIIDEMTVAVCLTNGGHRVLREICIPLGIDALSAYGLIIFEDQQGSTCRLPIVCRCVLLAVMEGLANADLVQSRSGELSN